MTKIVITASDLIHALAILALCSLTTGYVVMVSIIITLIKLGKKFYPYV